MSLLANIKSAEKRTRVIAKKTALNRARKSQMKTYIKKFEVALENGNYDDAKELLKVVESNLDKAASKNVISKNAASRKVSRLAKRLNSAM